MQVIGQLEVKTASPPKKVQGIHWAVLRGLNRPSGCFYWGQTSLASAWKGGFLNVAKPIESKFIKLQATTYTAVGISTFVYLGFVGSESTI